MVENVAGVEELISIEKGKEVLYKLKAGMPADPTGVVVEMIKQLLIWVLHASQNKRNESRKKFNKMKNHMCVTVS